MFALLTVHVIASTILLNRALTLWAFLRVTLDPISSLTVVLTLLEPKSGDSAYDGPMIIIHIASKTERMSFGTRDDGNKFSQGRFKSGPRA